MNKKDFPTDKQPISNLPDHGLSTKTLALILGVNALISTVISLLVVLVVGPWAFTGAVQGFPTAEKVSAAPTPLAQSTPLDQITGSPSAIAPVATPSVTPIPEPELYVVQVGDSLSGIAANFGVTVDEIMAANGFNNPDYLQAGQTLLIPVGGLANATPTFTPNPVPTDTPIPFDPPSLTENSTAQPAVDISLTPTFTPSPIPTATAPAFDEIAVDINNVLGYGQLEQEMVILFNRGPGLSLSGWKLTGAKTGDYNFPNLFLWNGGSVRIHTVTGTNTPTDLYWDQEAPVWFSGDTLELKNARGEVVATYTIP